MIRNDEDFREFPLTESDVELAFVFSFYPQGKNKLGYSIQVLKSTDIRTIAAKEDVLKFSDPFHMNVIDPSDKKYQGIFSLLKKIEQDDQIVPNLGEKNSVIDSPIQK